MARTCAGLSQWSSSGRSRSPAPRSRGTAASPRSSPASPNAERINDSYFWVAIFTGAIFLLVQGSLLWFIVRYRAADAARTEDGAQVHGNTNLELAWTVAPVLILVAIGIVRLLQAAGDPGRPERERPGRTRRRAGEGLPLLLAVHVSERRHRGRQAARARRPDGQARRLRARLRRDPLLVDPRARRQVRRDPGHDERDVVQRRGARGSTAASAPSSAASSTR